MFHPAEHNRKILQPLFLELKNHGLLKQQQQKKNHKYQTVSIPLVVIFARFFIIIIFNFVRKESLIDHRIHRWKSTKQINAAEFQRNLLIQRLFEMGLARLSFAQGNPISLENVYFEAEARLKLFLMEKVSRVTCTPLKDILYKTFL